MHVAASNVNYLVRRKKRFSPPKKEIPLGSYFIFLDQLRFLKILDDRKLNRNVLKKKIAGGKENKPIDLYKTTKSWVYSTGFSTA